MGQSRVDAAFPGSNGNLAWSSWNATTGGAIYIGDPDTGTVGTWYAPGSDASLFRVAWSPDGSRLAYTAHGLDDWGSASTILYVANEDGTGHTNLSTTQSNDLHVLSNPAWSPDGTQLAFIAGPPSGEENIYVVPADGSSSPTPITLPAEAPHLGAAFIEWSPDGTQFALTAQTEAAVWLIAADGSSATQLLPPSSTLFPLGPPDWSPDGSAIVFPCMADCVDNTDEAIVRIDADGTNLTRLTPGGTVSNEAVWSPDGTKIAYVHNEAFRTVPATGGTASTLLTFDSSIAPGHFDWQTLDGAPPSAPDPSLTVDPTFGPAGTQFTSTGSGFTADSTVTSHLEKPDGSEFSPLTLTTDSNGDFTHTIDSDGFDDGTYTQWVVDDTTSVNSDEVTFDVTVPIITIEPASGSPGTIFTTTGTGFTPNAEVTSHLRKPDGSEFPPLTLTTDASGSFSHEIDSTGFAPGTYTQWVEDDSTGATSQEAHFSVETTDTPIPPRPATETADLVPFIHSGALLGCTYYNGCANGYHQYPAVDVLLERRTPIYAAGSGRVVSVYSHCLERDWSCPGYGLSDGVGGYGNVVVIEHPDGRRSYYAHLDEPDTDGPGGVLVRRGQRVQGGETQIGWSGATGFGWSSSCSCRTPIPHLHYEERTSPWTATLADRVDPGPMHALHGGSMVTYPQALVPSATSWSQVPAFAHDIRNDGYP